jgi:Spy/CpxP family protein refolding chaperone
MNRKWGVATLLAVVIVFAAVTADAWPGDGKRRGDGPRERDKMRERIGMMMMWRLTDVLELDQETAAKVFPLMREYDEQQRNLRDKRRDIVKKLQDTLDQEKSDPTALTGLIGEFKQNERDMVEMRNKRLDALSEVLSDEQVAKLIVCIPQFEHEMRGMMRHGRDAREMRRSMPGRWYDDGPWETVPQAPQPEQEE